MKAAIVVLSALALVAGCGPYQQELYEDIGPNETGFYVPLEGRTSDGGKFDSLEVVEKMKVAAKRITIPTRKLDTGRMGNDYKWIPTGRVIKVHRSAETCEWLDDDNAPIDALHFGSQDGIAFHLGFTATAHIDENHAARFLYNWGPRELKDVINTNVRSSLQTALTQKFGQHSLMECLSKFTEFSTEAAGEVSKDFLERGVTIDFMGPQGKPVLENKDVQKVLDEKFIAENSKSIAANRAAAQLEQNRQLVAQAEGEASIKIAAVRGEAERVRQMAEADAYQVLTRAKAEAEGNAARAKALEGEGGARLVQLAQVEKWQGGVPGTVVNGSGGATVPIVLPIPLERSK